MAAFSDVHVQLLSCRSMCHCVSSFPFMMLYIDPCTRYHNAISFAYICMSAAGTSDILTLVYTTGLLVFGLAFAGTV